jgi:hypothetical protein
VNATTWNPALIASEARANRFCKDQGYNPLKSAAFLAIVRDTHDRVKRNSWNLQQNPGRRISPLRSSE